MKTKLLLLLLLANFSIYAQTNLVPNGGFESWTAGTLQNWTVFNSVSKSSDAVEGLQSAKLTTYSSVSKITNQVPLKAGGVYIIKYKYKHLGNTNDFDGIVFKISQDGSATSLSSTVMPFNNNWNEKEFIFKPDADLNYELSIAFYHAGDNPADILIDDVSIVNIKETEFTFIPDPNFEAKLISLGIDSGTPDRKVLTKNISSVTSLNVTDSSIEDLTGIEEFTDLTYLSAGMNQITTLDLSSNKSLTSLSIRENKLKDLNIQSNVLLNFLSLDKNELTTLDVSQNINLTYLGVNYNQLTSIDLSTNLQLKNVVISNNQLTTLDLSKNNALTLVLCSTNKLTSLNLKNNPNLTILNCHENILTSLDISANINLTDLTCFRNDLTSLDLTNNTKLGYVDCSFNKITALDISKNINLSTFYSDTNQLTALDVSKNTLLNNLSIADNSLTTIDVSKNKELIIFYCYSNLLTSVDISGNTKITRLQVDLNKLTSLNLKNGNNTIFDRKYTNFNKNPNLTCILVDDVAYSNANWSNLKDATAKYTLDCSTEFVQIADSNFEQKLIDLGIDTDGLNGKITIANIAGITSLNLSNSNIKDLSGIENFTALTFLDCSDNQLTALDVSKNLALETLNASTNQITTLDFSKNTKLKIVYVTNNPLISLNLQNGNNRNFVVPAPTDKKTASLYTSFLGLTTLSCIKVDDPNYSNANWSKIKEPTTTYSATCSTLGIEDAVFDKAVVYPNPTKGEVNINNIALEKATVYNSLGQLVKSFTLSVNNTNNTINLSGLPKGVYYVYLINKDAASAKKVIVE